MIDRDHDLSIVRQAKVLKLARSTVYYEPRPVSAATTGHRRLGSCPLTAGNKSFFSSPPFSFAFQSYALPQIWGEAHGR